MFGTVYRGEAAKGVLSGKFGTRRQYTSSADAAGELSSELTRVDSRCSKADPPTECNLPDVALGPCAATDSNAAVAVGGC